MRLRGGAAFIAGGGRGIGAAVARAFVAEGAAVFLVARTAAELEAVAAELAGAGGRVAFTAADVASGAAVDAAFDECAARIGTPGVVVNAAAVAGPIGLLWETDPEAWWHAQRVNLLGTMLVCRAAVPRMLERGGGSIINFSGGGATAPRPRFSAYAASKAAVVRLTETLAEELRGTGITVNAIAPGMVDTRLQDAILDAGPAAGAEREGVERLRSGGAGGVSADVAAALAVHLASEAAAGLTGKLVSAVHDPWQKWGPSHVAAMDGTAWLTLRRLDRHTLAALPAGATGVPA